MPKAYNPNDIYFRKAQKEGLRARSAFKLDEIFKKFKKLIDKKSNVLDLGSAPGSFLQIIEKQIINGKLCGVDLNSIKPFPETFLKDFKFIKGDVFNIENIDYILEFFEGKKVDLITSDMAPKTSGIKSVDQWKSIELNQEVLHIAEKVLKTNGNLVSKIFKGEDFEEFWVSDFKDKFKVTKTFKPKACRDRSYEIFLIGIGWQG
jgi:23S rRNA (uridine2552-2'-O)-methyltransferase